MLPFLGAVSSAVEHHLDTVGVTGSNPVSRTIFLPFYWMSKILDNFCVLRFYCTSLSPLWMRLIR